MALGRLAQGAALWRASEEKCQVWWHSGMVIEAAEVSWASVPLPGTPWAVCGFLVYMCVLS